MVGETQALSAWSQLAPTICDSILLLMIIGATIYMVRQIKQNRTDRIEQITALQNLFKDQTALLDKSFLEHLNSVQELLQELKDGKTWTNICMERHKQISKDIENLVKITDDHERRLREAEPYLGRERRREPV